MSKEFKLEHEGQFRLVADLLTEGFLIHNDKAEIVMHNRAVLNLLGLNELQLKNIKPIPKYFKMMCGDSGQEFQLEDLIKNVINDRMEIKNKIIGVQIDDQMNFKWMHLTCRSFCI
jgi:PAS domain-containing protein